MGNVLFFKNLAQVFMLGKALGRGIYWNLAHTWLNLI
jgi:hypothetical protein